MGHWDLGREHAGLWRCAPSPAPTPQPWGEGLLSQVQAVRPQPDLLTFGWHVGQGCEFLGVDDGDIKCGLHGRLIKAGERLPGICRLHLCGGQHPAQSRGLEGAPTEYLCPWGCRMWLGVQQGRIIDAPWPHPCPLTHHPHFPLSQAALRPTGQLMWAIRAPSGLGVKVLAAPILY